MILPVIISVLVAGAAGFETGFNNSCLYKDDIWNMYRNNSEMIHYFLRKYFVEDWESISSMGTYVRVYDELERLLDETLVAFPDIKLHIVDSFCEGNDVDGYKTTMPVIHTATHLGWHPVFGEPSGKTLTWFGIPNCFIKKVDGEWKYISEVNMPDSLDLYKQLGVDIPSKTFDLALSDCEQLFDWDTGYINPRLVPQPLP